MPYEQRYPEKGKIVVVIVILSLYLLWKIHRNDTTKDDIDRTPEFLTSSRLTSLKFNIFNTESFHRQKRQAPSNDEKANRKGLPGNNILSIPGIIIDTLNPDKSGKKLNGKPKKTGLARFIPQFSITEKPKSSKKGQAKKKASEEDETAATKSKTKLTTTLAPKQSTTPKAPTKLEDIGVTEPSLRMDKLEKQDYQVKWDNQNGVQTQDDKLIAKSDEIGLPREVGVKERPDSSIRQDPHLTREDPGRIGKKESLQLDSYQDQMNSNNNLKNQLAHNNNMQNELKTDNNLQDPSDKVFQQITDDQESLKKASASARKKAPGQTEGESGLGSGITNIEDGVVGIVTAKPKWTQELNPLEIPGEKLVGIDMTTVSMQRQSKTTPSMEATSALPSRKLVRRTTPSQQIETTSTVPPTTPQDGVDLSAIKGAEDSPLGGEMEEDEPGPNFDNPMAFMTAKPKGKSGKGAKSTTQPPTTLTTKRVVQTTTTTTTTSTTATAAPPTEIVTRRRRTRTPAVQHEAAPSQHVTEKTETTTTIETAAPVQRRRRRTTASPNEGNGESDASQTSGPSTNKPLPVKAEVTTDLPAEDDNAEDTVTTAATPPNPLDELPSADNPGLPSMDNGTQAGKKDELPMDDPMKLEEQTNMFEGDGMMGGGGGFGMFGGFGNSPSKTTKKPGPSSNTTSKQPVVSIPTTLKPQTTIPPRTSPPGPVTQAPVKTTPPAASTKPTITTTKQPNTTTKPPITTTKSPPTTTNAPDPTEAAAEEGGLPDLETPTNAPNTPEDKLSKFAEDPDGNFDSLLGGTGGEDMMSAGKGGMGGFGSFMGRMG